MSSRNRARRFRRIAQSAVSTQALETSQIAITSCYLSYMYNVRIVSHRDTDSVHNPSRRARGAGGRGGAREARQGRPAPRAPP